MSRSDTKYTDESFPFICKNCGVGICNPPQGTMNRNHCPNCLFSRHLDHRVGDRLSVCRGLMEPIGIWVKDDGEWAIIHRCIKCGIIRTNRIAGDDDTEKLFALAAKPLSGKSFNGTDFIRDTDNTKVKVCSHGL